MTEQLRHFDAADQLDSEGKIVAYLDACAEDDDPQLMVAALGQMARARNMMELARQTGITRAGLYKALSGEGNPSFATVVKVADSLGLQLSFKAKPE
ncbi:MAG: putative addiction module antidote protein [Xanthomonadales bacterium]|nr:putative addiction module antidote protein [Xanthomonadales bacterium]